MIDRERIVSAPVVACPVALAVGPEIDLLAAEFGLVVGDVGLCGGVLPVLGRSVLRTIARAGPRVSTRGRSAPRLARSVHAVGVMACGPAVVSVSGGACGRPVVGVVRVTGSVMLARRLGVAGLLGLPRGLVAPG